MLQVFDERNRDLVVNVGGKLSHRDQAGVSPFDSAVQGGDAVWEGLRLYAGRIFRLTEHLDRLRASAQALAFGPVPPDEEIIEQIRRTLAANGMRDGVHIRLTLTRGVKLTSGMDPRLNTSGPTLIVLAEFKAPVYDAAGITLVTASVRRPAPDCLDPKIHHNNLLPSILAKIEANVAGADDAVMLDPRGFIAETNATHIFMMIRGTLATPTTASCPEGITRAAVLELAAEAGLDEEDRFRLAMSVREAAVNAVLHGNEYDPSKQISASFENTGKALVITIADQGNGIDLETLKDPLAPENLLRGTGRGIFLIRSFMDEVHFRQLHPGTELTLVKHLAAAGEKT